MKLNKNNNSKEKKEHQELFDKIVSEFERQKVSPPGEDICISSCYSSLLKLIENSDQSAIDVIESTISKRPYIAPQYFVNLFFRTVQYIELYKRTNAIQYPIDLQTDRNWDQELSYILKHHGNTIKSLLTTKDTVTTVYQRYAGPQLLINALSDGGAVIVADLGCGGNFGLPGMEMQIPFEQINDYSKGKEITPWLYPAPDIEAGVALDKENLQNVNTKKWQIACSFYPSELGKLANLPVFEEKIAAAEKTKFMQTDLCKTLKRTKYKVQPQSVDFIIISTVLYQLGPKQYEVFLQNAQRILKPSGTMIIQDFARKAQSDPQKLDFNTEWFSKDAWSYRTFILNQATDWEFQEMLQWSNGRCRYVREGEDFQLIASRAAVAHSTS